MAGKELPIPTIAVAATASTTSAVTVPEGNPDDNLVPGEAERLRELAGSPRPPDDSTPQPATHDIINHLGSLNTNRTVFKAHAFNVIDDIMVILKNPNNWHLIVDLETEDGETLLHLAAAENRVDIIKKVLSELKNKDFRSRFLFKSDKNQKTALHHSAESGAKDAFMLLYFHSSELLSSPNILPLRGYPTDGQCAQRPCHCSCAIPSMKKLADEYFIRPFMKKPRVLIFYNKYGGMPEYERPNAEQEWQDVKAGLESKGYKDIQGCTTVNFNQITMERRIRESTEHWDNSALIVFIMTHGDQGAILDINLNQIPVDTIREWMSPESMAEVPKVLILQRCRSTEQLAIPVPTGKFGINSVTFGYSVRE